MWKLIGDGEFQNVSLPGTLPGIEFSAPKDFQFFQSSESAFNQIIEALKNDETRIIGLYGMGGVGKTTLAKAVGNKLSKEIFDEVVMVFTSQTPDFRKIHDELADLSDLKFKEESEVGRVKQLYLRFTRTDQKTIVIMDDVWIVFDLKEEIGIPFGYDHKGCKIRQLMIQLNVWYGREGLTLLKKHASISDDHAALNDVAVEVLDML
ncbi:disease resistance protein SUMM2-like [Pistacia vera]|uniref:disease resistance protein SUMM2-like n=1 Tax=Pistacia vera TaxID=55513 RepID=UPI001262B44C|nr:disease resistance protein SUMM2-like [Pistacia vera]XP_031258683.1 disease resistance protein SUMM2-like [Pistacia vera]XP_031258684.1 disease resistance protein SUMM2-like [Pistacia vera]